MQVWQFILLHILLRHVFASTLRSFRFAISNFRCDKFSPTKNSTKSYYVRFIRQRLPDQNEITTKAKIGTNFHRSPKFFSGKA